MFEGLEVEALELEVEIADVLAAAVVEGARVVDAIVSCLLAAEVTVALLAAEVKVANAETEDRVELLELELELLAVLV